MEFQFLVGCCLDSVWFRLGIVVLFLWVACLVVGVGGFVVYVIWIFASLWLGDAGLDVMWV